MKGISQAQLGAMVEFIYHGQVSIDQEDLNSFLILAEELKIRGLDGSENDKQEQDNRKYNPKFPTSRKHQIIKQESEIKTLEYSDHHMSVEVPDVSQDEGFLVPADNFDIKSKTNYEELNETINSMH